MVQFMEMLGNICAQYENIMSSYPEMVCGTRLVVFVCRGWYEGPPWLSKFVVGGGPGDLRHQFLWHVLFL